MNEELIPTPPHTEPSSSQGTPVSPQGYGAPTPHTIPQNPKGFAGLIPQQKSEPVSLPIQDDTSVDALVKKAREDARISALKMQQSALVNPPRTEDALTPPLARFTPEEEKAKALMKALRTFQGDAQEAVARTQASVASIALAEQEKRRVHSSPPPAPPSKTKALLAIATATLSITAAALLIGFYFVHRSQLPVEGEVTPQAVIATETTRALAFQGLNKNSLTALIYSSRNDPALAGPFIQLSINQRIPLPEGKVRERPIGPQEFFSLIRASAGQPLLRSFGESMMFGIASTTKESARSGFLIIEVQNFEQAFDGMLRYEPRIYADIGSLLSSRTTPDRDERGIEIWNDPEPEREAVFTDTIITNKNARVLKNTRGDTILVYGFIKPTFLVITTNESLFSALNERVFSKNIVR